MNTNKAMIILDVNRKDLSKLDISVLGEKYSQCKLKAKKSFKENSKNKSEDDIEDLEIKYEEELEDLSVAYMCLKDFINVNKNSSSLNFGELEKSSFTLPTKAFCKIKYPNKCTESKTNEVFYVRKDLKDKNPLFICKTVDSASEDDIVVLIPTDECRDGSHLYTHWEDGKYYSGCLKEFVDNEKIQKEFERAFKVGK